jgi:hypothetical protein
MAAAMLPAAAGSNCQDYRVFLVFFMVFYPPTISGRKMLVYHDLNVGIYPLVNVYKKHMERSTTFNGNIHELSMAIFNNYITNYQRVFFGPRFFQFVRDIVGDIGGEKGVYNYGVKLVNNYMVYSDIYGIMNNK